MGLPYRISTLLYVFDRQDRVLLLERAREPNRGLWSPPGGKLQTPTGESPWACALREAQEELGLTLQASDLALTGIVSERGYQGSGHWLMFLFEVRPRIESVPPPMQEGRLAFFARSELDSLPIPRTDRDRIWPWFWQHRDGFFAAHCRCDTSGNSADAWTLEASVPPAPPNAEADPPDRSPSFSGPVGDHPSTETVSIAAQEDASDRVDPYHRLMMSEAAAVATAEPWIDLTSDHRFMGEALRQAVKAFDAGEVPVGAIVVLGGRIVARASNQVELLKDATAHAEMLAITQAEAAIGDWRLNDCTLYVTKEPCPMCAGAMVHARLGRVVFGAPDPKAGCAGSALNLLQFASFNHRCQVTAGVREDECRRLLKTFFAEQRARSG